MTVYEARHAGRTYCNDTEGSEHYKGGEIEPLDLAIADGSAEDFILVSITKYAKRFKRTRNCNDLKKISDYAHILCGVELDKNNTHAAIESEPNSRIPTQAEYEEMFTEDKPKGKYEGLNNNELYNAICNAENSVCVRCILPNYLGTGDKYFSEGCGEWIDENPVEFRKIAIAYLEGLEGKA